MVAPRGSSSSLTNRGTQDQRIIKRGGQAKNFKIYSEVDRANMPDCLKDYRKVKPIPSNGGTHVNDNSDSKGDNRITESIHKPNKSVKENVARKVLGDISNVEAKFSEAEQGKGSTTEKVKMGKMMHLQRETVKLGSKGQSSEKPYRERVRTNLIQATAEKQAQRKSVNRNTKTTSADPKPKFPIRKSVTATGRTSVRNPLQLARKSLPVLKQASQVETSGRIKENFYKPENFSEKLSVPVGPSIRRSTIPKPFNFSKRPQGSRVSDGFVLMGSSAQPRVQARVLTRNSVKATMRTTKTAVDTHVNSKSKNKLATHKLKSVQAVVPNRRQDKGSLPKDLTVVSHEEPGSEEVNSGVTSDPDPKFDVKASRKSDRRNSYTSSLISRSKDCNKVIPGESLPSIYDGRNHLEVSEYIEDIYQYYWFMEGQNPVLKNYLEIQTEITPQMRGILINWLIEVHLKFDLMEETLYLTVTILDRYLSLEIMKKNEMQLVGLTALLLASKYEDFWHPRVIDLISISAESYTRDQVLIMEKTILKKLKFRLNEPTPYVFMLRFLKAAQSDMKFQHLAFYLIELCLVEYEALNFKPSMLCASAIYVARCTLKMTPAWTQLLEKNARYEQSQLRECAEMIIRFHKAAKTNLLRVTYEKYMTPVFSKVATIKPLNSLPV